MPKISKLTLGNPEKITPITFNNKTSISADAELPPIAEKIEFKETARGCTIKIPMDLDEEVFGFGLQLKSMRQRGTKKHLRINADPLSDSGDSHAPVPFYATNKGYGIFVDTLRNVSFYVGRTTVPSEDFQKREIATSEAALYGEGARNKNDYMVIDIPTAKGVDLYFFQGDTITDITASYNMFSGGGCLPPIWGLGILYRCYAKHSQNDVLKLAKQFREKNIPCDIIGLEPGWQTRSYSCSFKWNPELFPNPEAMTKELLENGYHINLWEHAFTHPDSPIYEKLKPYSGDYTVWNGLVPDFTIDKAREIFSDYHKKVFTDKGIDGFKLDECDGSDFTGGWTFPNCTEFPAGLDGEQMHAVFGKLYQDAILESLNGKETFSEVRNAGPFAAPYPFVLYSDLYDYSDFLRGCTTAGFSGLLWAPEVRHSKDKNELLRRIQMAVFSVQTVINNWYLENPPWDSLGGEDEVKKLFETRMSLIPYLHSAFYKYKNFGKAPVRALVSDYTYDAATYAIDTEYLFGDNIIVCPISPENNEREVYLPEGEWYDFWTNKKYSSGNHIIKTENIPVFVKSGSLLPLAKPQNHYSTDEKTEITLCFYGKGGEIKLYDDITNKIYTLNETSPLESLGRYVLTDKKFI